METISTIHELRVALRAPRTRGGLVGFVPTMGALHEGHLSLIRRARAETASVVVSIFVNPLQFNDAADLRAYPRDADRDAALAREAGGDVLFLPSVEEMYPAGFSTTVSVGGISAPFEGAVRGEAHFTGVATVVLELFNIVQPDRAYFGEKDAQQLRVIRRMVRDLALTVDVVACPTVREADGLAMSSRNVRLDADARRRAVALARAIDAAQRAVDAGERSTAAIAAVARETMRDFDVVPDYCEVVANDDLTPIDIMTQDALLLVAAPVGGVRLLDNATLRITR